MQDKYGISTESTDKEGRERGMKGRETDLSESSSSSEEEDEDGVLALGALDEQVQSTLEAIRMKDPRVYDANIKFYNDPEQETKDSIESKGQQEKPLYLSDYHRKTLLEGGGVVDDAENHEGDPPTYQQQQDELKTSIVKEMHAAANGSGSEENSDRNSEKGFLIRKVVQSQEKRNEKDAKSRGIILDVESADKDPETYLSNFMSVKGWVTSDTSKAQPFESDDEEEDRRAEAFEEGYNLRFEDPKASNEKLLSHARDAAAKHSVRKEEVNPRKRKRDIDRARKDAERELRLEEKKRLRKLKVADMQGKLEKIKDAAGWKGNNMLGEEWSAFLDDAWDDEHWDQEMGKRFGDDYYEKHDVEDGDDDRRLKPKKIKKPRWKDDIDISDLVPDFDREEEDDNLPSEIDVGAAGADRRSKDSAKTKLKAEQDRRKEKRLERHKIEQKVDEQLDIDEALANYGKKHAGNFRYRETSPLTHGLTAHDILMADDSQLNQFAGLKKLAAFREPDKKRKDKKFLGKKQRLKQWRKDTFGNEHGPTKTLAEVLAGQTPRDASGPLEGLKDGDTEQVARSKKRSRKTGKSKLAA